MFWITNRARGARIIGLAALMSISSIARAADCNNNGIEDAQDISDGTSLDCQPDGVPDECQLIPIFLATSEPLAPIDDSHPQTYTLVLPPPASGPVSVTIRASADIGSVDERITVLINDVNVGRVFDDNRADCSTVPDVDTLVIPAADYNWLVIADAVIRLVPASVTAGACAAFYAIVEVEYNLPPNDCNANGIPDDCDIADLTSDDCNGDGVPDECQPDIDCNANTIRDLCDIGAGTSADCNANLVPDACDIANGSSVDTNSDGVPDECELAILPGNDVCVGGAASGSVCSHHGDCPGGRCHTKNRFISVIPQASGAVAASLAIQVKVVDVPANRPPAQQAMEGDIWWAGPPVIGPEGPPGGSFKASLLHCTGTPHLRPWSEVGLVHLYGPSVVPGTTYEVRLCDAMLACSDPLVVTTATYGDIVPPLSATATDFLDVSALLDKFKGLPVAPSKTRAQLTPNTLNLTSNIGFLTISEGVYAFQGFVYGYSGASCP